MKTKAIMKAKRERDLGNPTEEDKVVVEKVVELVKEKQIKLNKRQYNFIENYLLPTSPTFANSYQSAVKAGFSKSYSTAITSNTLDLWWVREAKKNLVGYEPEHIYRAFQGIVQSAAQDRDKLKALELMGKAKGMFIDRVQQDVKVTFINDVPRPLNETAERIIIDNNEVIDAAD